MNKITCRIFLVIGAMFWIHHISGQHNPREFDTIPIIKPKKNAFRYQFSYPPFSEIRLQFNSPENVRHRSSRGFLREFGRELATAATGIGFGSSTDLVWKTGGEVRCSNASPDWMIDLYCEGSQEKERERVRDEDGSWSVETEEINHFYWDRYATGTITENNDTIADFLIIMDPRQDSLLMRWSAYVFSQPETKVKSASKNPFYEDLYSRYSVDYGIIGKFRGKNFSLITNGSSSKSWIFSEDVLMCVFQMDLDDHPLVSRKERIMPYILMNRNFSGSQSQDVIRLVMMGRILDKILKLN